ncbi:hypothetical protein [Hyphomonas sp.]|uniref:hypothetical protein n=1 Tax=Hyphomonas sp. TaxID=87 RepID=UPI000C93368E|nr:hypothetical protein [Hyphomonas sp.]MAL44555.1 hypothetical protein [Hyphomonas sp.]|tara:strand:+ start:7937 stop:8194 length:258 start_codon:yes stop_codon:yes gene_type:complete
MIRDNIVDFPRPEDLDINDTEFWEHCSEIYRVFADLSVSLMRMQVADSDEVAGSLCVVAYALLKAKNMSDKEISEFANMIFKRQK